eukprot:SM000001S04647  [mRNA]  locus=s1:1421472:1422333:- [translate_table: standard]
MALVSFLGTDPLSLIFPDGDNDTDPFTAVLSSCGCSVPASYTQDQRAVANTDLDWVETPNAHVFVLDLPGVSKEDLKVRLEGDNVLVISANAKQPQDDKDSTYHRAERHKRQFLRRVRLPSNVDGKNIKAELMNGVLTVTVPKKEEQKKEAKHIDVTES